MRVYADASLIVSAFTDEPASAASRAWLGSLAPGALVFSKWCETEIASAVSLKVRTGALKSESGALVFRSVLTMLGDSATLVAIETVDFDRATALLAKRSTALRGGDALHLAIADRAGATLLTLDRRMAEAGIALGLDVRMLG